MNLFSPLCFYGALAVDGSILDVSDIPLRMIDWATEAQANSEE